MDLLIYLSNRCNLTCDYCPVLLNQGQALFLDESQVRRAIDLYLSHIPGANSNIILQGGEPFLRWPLLLDAAEYARSFGPRVNIHVFTNGALLTRERFEALRRLGVSVTLSLDGKAETTDQARRFFGDEENRSVFAEVHRRLVAERIDPSDLRVNMVITPQNVQSLVQNIAFLHRLGFSSISFQPDAWGGNGLAAHWSQKNLQQLQLALESFSVYYSSILARELRPFLVHHLFMDSTNGGGSDLDNEWEGLILGPDGSFYPAISLLGFSPETIAPYRMGGLKTGLSLEKRRAFLDEAKNFLRPHFGGNCHSIMLSNYFYARAGGLDPLPLLRTVHGIYTLFTANFESLFRRLSGEPHFLQLYSGRGVG